MQYFPDAATASGDVDDETTSLLVLLLLFPLKSGGKVLRKHCARMSTLIVCMGNATISTSELPISHHQIGIIRFVVCCRSMIQYGAAYNIINVISTVLTYKLVTGRNDIQ